MKKHIPTRTLTSNQIYKDFPHGNRCAYSTTSNLMSFLPDIIVLPNLLISLQVLSLFHSLAPMVIIFLNIYPLPLLLHSTFIVLLNPLVCNSLRCRKHLTSPFPCSNGHTSATLQQTLKPVCYVQFKVFSSILYYNSSGAVFGRK